MVMVMMTVPDIIKKLQHRVDLTCDEVGHIMTDILSGDTDEQTVVDFLSNLTKKGETDSELVCMLEKMQEFALRVEIDDNISSSPSLATAIDMCGTGGDRLETFNISTTASFVVAAAGGLVAKHGNRSSLGVSGSSDIFEYFGYDLNQEPDKITTILRENNICFMFAQKFHPAMRHVSAARRQIRTRTAFNILGPLSNPARVANQLVGVSNMKYLTRLPAILKRSGSKNIISVCSNNGMDELSTSGTNHVCILKDGDITTATISPQDVGLHKSVLADIQVKTREDAIRSFVDVLNDTANQAMVETVALNAAGGFMVAGMADSFDDGTSLALDTIKSGRAFKCLERFVKNTGDVSKLEDVV